MLSQDRKCWPLTCWIRPVLSERGVRGTFRTAVNLLSLSSACQHLLNRNCFYCIWCFCLDDSFAGRVFLTFMSDSNVPDGGIELADLFWGRVSWQQKCSWPYPRIASCLRRRGEGQVWARCPSALPWLSVVLELVRPKPKEMLQPVPERPPETPSHRGESLVGKLSIVPQVNLDKLLLGGWNTFQRRLIHCFKKLMFLWLKTTV